MLPELTNWHSGQTKPPISGTHNYICMSFVARETKEKNYISIDQKWPISYHLLKLRTTLSLPSGSLCCPSSPNCCIYKKNFKFLSIEILFCISKLCICLRDICLHKCDKKKNFGDNDKISGYFLCAKNCLNQSNSTFCTSPLSYHREKWTNCAHIKLVLKLVLFSTP